MASIHLRDSVAAALRAQAQARGLSLEQYLELLSQSGGPSQEPRIAPQDLDRLLDAEAAPGPAYQGSYSRADIYLDHD